MASSQNADGIQDVFDMALRAMKGEWWKDHPPYLTNFIESARFVQGPLDGSRLAYAQYVLSKLTAVGTTIRTFPKVCFVSTLNKVSELVRFKEGLILVIDDYLFQTLEEMSRLYVSESSHVERGAFGLRLLTERFLVNDRKALAAHTAIAHSVLMNSCNRIEPLSSDRETEQIDAVQLTFLLSHEVAHILSAQGAKPSDFNKRAMRWISEDAKRTIPAPFEALADSAMKVLGPAPKLNTLLSFADMVAATGQEKLKSCISPERVEADRARRSEPNSPFIEELWADFYAWTSCMRLFFGNWPAEVVHKGVSLGLMNLASIDVMNRLAENASHWETADDLAARRRVLRLATTWFLAWARTDEAFQKHAGYSKESLAIDFAEINQKTDGDYQDVMWWPMVSEVFRLLKTEMPSIEVLNARHARLEMEFGPTPALRILREHPIDAPYLKRFLAVE